MIGHSTVRGTVGPITWGVVRGARIHLSCATEEEAMLTWAGFHGPGHSDAEQACERCNAPLSEHPDP